MPTHDLTPLRHTLAHLLAAAVQELYPAAKRSIGPAIEHGFYYDFEFPNPIGEEDLPRIEKKMRELLPSWESFTRLEVTPQQARDAFADSPYKQELIAELESKGESISLYYSGPKDSIPDLSTLQATSSPLVSLTCAAVVILNTRIKTLLSTHSS